MAENVLLKLKALTHCQLRTMGYLSSEWESVRRDPAGMNEREVDLKRCYRFAEVSKGSWFHPS